jgi:His-Xaa-Ser system protein HxsD
VTRMVNSHSNDQLAAPDGLGGTFSNGGFKTQIDLRVYRLVAVQKTAYRHARYLSVILGAIRDQQLELQVLFAANTAEPAAREQLRTFFRDLLDQELREKIGEQTHALRALILAQAFSKTDLIQREP